MDVSEAFMSRKMTVVFHDEDLYTYLKVEAARRHMPASEIMADAVREWLENREDTELLPVIDAAKTKWNEKGGRAWSDVERELEESVSLREGTTEAKRV
jgi:hypothetical protein